MPAPILSLDLNHGALQSKKIKIRPAQLALQSWLFPPGELSPGERNLMAAVHNINQACCCHHMR